MDKKEQERLLIEIMEADEKDGLYEIPSRPFNTASLREITDQYDRGDISYGKMVDLINEKAILWHNTERNR